MLTGPKGEKRPADVIGNAVRVMRVLTGEIKETIPDDGKDLAAKPRRNSGFAPTFLLACLAALELDGVRLEDI